MTVKIDLHTHTTASDGRLTPNELVRYAREEGIDVLAITDHDTIAAYQKIDNRSCLGLELIVGTEFSAQWQGVGIHIVGLNLDLNSTDLLLAFDQQARARLERAEQIVERLLKRHKINLEKVLEINPINSWIGRPDFARAMVDEGIVPDEATAFRRYLGRGKAGDVKAMWPEIATVIAWIRAAGGIAVLAHPLRYRLSNMKLKRLLTDFCAAGGAAIEVISGSQHLEHTHYLARLSAEFELLASVGSDFHRPSKWSAPGKIQALPNNCRPVWSAW